MVTGNTTVVPMCYVVCIRYIVQYIIKYTDIQRNRLARALELVPVLVLVPSNSK